MVGLAECYLNFSYAHRIIRFSGYESQRINQEIIEFYQSGMSIREVAKLTNKSFGKVNSILRKAGIELRPNRSISFRRGYKLKGKQNILPPYGFCYFQGKVIPDPREYDNLLVIYRLWQKKQTPNAIMRHLNSKQIPARKASNWNRNSVVLILKRFESGLIVHKGGQLEIR